MTIRILYFIFYLINYSYFEAIRQQISQVSLGNFIPFRNVNELFKIKLNNS